MRTLCSVVVAFLGLYTSIGALAQSSAIDPQNLPLGAAVLSDAKGEVLVTAPNDAEAKPAQKGQLLAPNSTIECKKGTALLALSDGSQVLVKSNTKVILRVPDEAKGNFLEQLIGKITATVKKRATGDPAFKMGTPTAVITVRGTKFVVEVSKKQQTYVQVMEGIVEVNGLSTGGRPVLLQPGYFTQVGNNMVPENPRRLMREMESENGGGGGVNREHATDDRSDQKQRSSHSGPEQDD